MLPVETTKPKRNTSLRAIPTLHTHELTTVNIHNPKQHKSITLSEPQRALKHEGTNMKCKPNCAPGGTLIIKQKPDWQAALAGYWRDPLANTGKPLQLDAGRKLGRIHRQGLSRILGGIHWRATWLWWDTRRDSLASYAGGILGWIHWRATLGYSAGYSAGSSGLLGGIHWRAALAGYSAGPLASRSSGILSCSNGIGILGGIH